MRTTDRKPEELKWRFLNLMGHGLLDGADHGNLNRQWSDATQRSATLVGASARGVSTEVIATRSARLGLWLIGTMARDDIDLWRLRDHGLIEYSEEQLRVLERRHLSVVRP